MTSLNTLKLKLHNTQNCKQRNTWTNNKKLKEKNPHKTENTYWQDIHVPPNKHDYS